MRIGIIGSDDRAVAIGRLLSRAHEVTMADPCDADTVEHAAAAIGAKADTPYRQAMCSDIIFLAGPRKQDDAALDAMGAQPPAVIVDARDGGPSKPHCGAEMLAQKLNSHRIVRALIVLATEGANIQICGDDATAKSMVSEAFSALGCVTTDRGPLSASPELEPVQPTYAA